MTKLVLEGLRKRFGEVHAIKDLHLDVAEGELISLLGPSGCGKTTTLRCVAGFEYPDEGRILFDGGDVTDLPPERRDIGMVFQNYALFPHMTVYENLAFGLEMRKVDRDSARRRIEHVLGMVQLGAMPERFPRQLSGGQQQRVALARALVIEPRMLLLDEPLANLDAILREEMRFFIRDLQKRVGITTLYVTHDQAEAMVMSDRIVVMFDGAIAQLGRPAEIYARPVSQRVAKFIGRSNFVEGTIEGHLGGGAHRVSTPIGAITGQHEPPLPVGRRVVVGMRPEGLGLADTRLDGTESHGCVVEQTYFLGNAVDHIVRCAGDSRFLVQTAPGRSLAAGRDAWLTIDPDHAWIMVDEG